MGRKKNTFVLILVFFTLINLHSSAFALHHDDRRFSLQGLKEVLISTIIIYSDPERKPAWLNKHRLRIGLTKDIGRKLKMAGIKPLNCPEWLTTPRKPILYVNIKITQNGQNIYKGKLNLYQNVYLERQPTVGTFFMNTWSYDSTRQGAFSVNEESIRDFGRSIAEGFIEAHRFANSGEKDLQLYSVGCLTDVDTLIKKLNHKDPHIRGSAVLSLGEIKDSRSVEPLIAMLNDEHREVRSWAAVALGNQQDSRAVGPLVAALKDEYNDVRLWAAEALGKIGDPRAVDPLIEVLEKDIGQINCLAAWGLKQITGQNFRYNHKQWREWWEQNKKNLLKEK